MFEGTAEQLLEIARREKPHIQYTRNEAGTAIAARRKDTDPWEMVAARLPATKLPDGRIEPGGGWVTMGNLLIDGVPTISDWIER